MWPETLLSHPTAHAHPRASVVGKKMIRSGLLRDVPTATFGSRALAW